MTRGALIVIEGGDGSGKQTQTKMLVDKLNSEGIITESISFPRYNTPTGRIVGQCYLGKQNLGEGDVAWFGDADKVDSLLASLYYAADRRAAAPEMKKKLNSGINLISDRYYQANMAHQGGKIQGLEKQMEFFQALGKIELDALEIPKEHRTIFLNMPWRVAFELRKGRGEAEDGHESNKGHLSRAEEVYKRLASINEGIWERIDCAPDGTINSLRTPLEIHEEVYRIAKRTIDLVNGKSDTPYKD